MFTAYSPLVRLHVRVFFGDVNLGATLSGTDMILCALFVEG